MSDFVGPYTVVARGLYVAVRDGNDKLVAEMPPAAAAEVHKQWPKMRRFFRDLAKVSRDLGDFLNKRTQGET